MKIAHISDLHYGLSYSQNHNAEKLLARIHSFGVDHLVITGDLTAFGDESHYEKLVALLKKFDFFSSDRLTVIPGNHDLFNHLLQYFHSAIDILKRFYKLPAALRRIIDFNILKYNKELQKFNDFMDKTFSNIIRKDQFTVYPFAKSITDDTVLVGIDSNKAIGVLENRAASNGMVSLNKVKTLLDDPAIENKRKIVLMHHYLYPENEMAQLNGKHFSRFMRLLNRNDVAQLLYEKNVDLVLHGHYHHNTTYQLGEDGPRVMGGGGSYRGPHWNLIDLEESDIKLQIKNGTY